MKVESEDLIRRLILARPELTINIIKGAHRFRVPEKSQIILRNVRRALDENPELALVIGCNHVAYPDPWLGYRAYQQYVDPERERDLYSLASEWNIDPNNNGLFSLLADISVHLLNCEYIPAIQSYMTKTPEAREKWGYNNNNEIRNKRRELIEKLVELRDGDHPRGVTLAIAVEGTRSPDGNLQQGDLAVRSVIRRLTPVLFLPVGIVYKGRFGRGLNLGRVVEVRAGEPIELSSGERIDHEEIMLGIAQLLPRHMRGEWAETI